MINTVVKHSSRFLIVVVFLCQSVVAGEITFVIEHLPAYHPKSEPVYLAGTINGWNAANPHYQFQADKNNRLTLTVPFNRVGDKVQFKLTRGTWLQVEVSGERRSIDNRSYTYRGGNYTEPLRVEHWEDIVGSLTRESTQTGVLKIFDQSVKYDDQYRTIRVLLPDDYEQHRDKRYAVLYMFDGQNLFDQATAAVGMEWGFDETMKTLQQSGKTPGLIVVGIDSGDVCRRFAEYTGWRWEDRECGLIKGQAFGHGLFLVNQVKPFIDHHFRTKKGKASTYIGGSSLGGYMAILTAISYQNTFSKVMGLSNALLDEYSGQELKTFILSIKKQRDIEFYLDIGNQEAVNKSNRSNYIVDANRQMYDTLLKAGFSSTQVTFRVIEGGVHDENSWGQRLPWIIELLGM